MSHGALVLLGNSGVGKDPIADILSDKYANVKNIKFSDLTKHVLAQFLRVPREYMEDKEWRNGFTINVRNRDTEITPLMLLNALYFGAVDSGLHEKNIKWTKEDIGNSFPVFTDIRRLNEYSSIANLKPLVIKLVNSEIAPGVSDEEQNRLYDLLNTAEVTKKTIDVKGADFSKIAKQLAEEVGLDKREKGTLNVYIGEFSLNPKLPEPQLPAISKYEPLSALVNQLENLLTYFGVDKGIIPSIVNNVASEIEPDEMAVEDFRGVRALVYRTYHEAFIKRLRKVFNLKVYILDESVRQYADVIFKQGEIQ